ncbi:MAG TPA: gephyrin-like molybdotransferase Glp [Ideonella sp.]|uniref:molybdopterin molybdotransferase MoeA n=1 Tax=Ideonella sp. TaxID=1929293 RepID=UPI002E366AC9|nr:gephyrin-like molybdotransferase Glp [Ideonella sp.]HEX5687587.1 gephyrin-like molybdotransferase Glp [Ideonella sp.]
MADPTNPSPKPPLMPLDEALARLTEVASARRIAESQDVPTAQALGRVLAAPVVSSLDVPPADNSSMDGYALRFADLAPEVILPVSQRIAAGAVGTVLEPATAARIFTGAPIPPGADTVVMQEQCEPLAVDAPEERARIRVTGPVEPGQWIRRRGEDVERGSTVLKAGTRLTPQALGLAASVGAATLQVLRRPRVALFSTGDELVMPGDPLPPGAIYNSNRFTLRALLEAAGCEVDDIGIVPDNLEATRQALRRAAQGNDLIITSGGVSVGEEDHLKPAVQAEGRLDLWQMAIKPGKPLAFGAVHREKGEALFIGLPGNPVSSFVTFLLAVAPVLRALQGLPAPLPRALPLPAGFDWPKPDKRREFLRVRLNEQGALELFANQSSGVLTSAVWADGLVDNPPGQTIAKGDTVRFLPLTWLVGA